MLKDNKILLQGRFDTLEKEAVKIINSFRNQNSNIKISVIENKGFDGKEVGFLLHDNESFCVELLILTEQRVFFDN